MPFKELEPIQSKAQKILGDGAKFPSPKVDMDKLAKEQEESHNAFKEGRDELQSRLQAFDLVNDSIVNGLQLYAAAYEKDDFGLDPKKKDDAKKIKQAQKIFGDYFSTFIKQMGQADKDIVEMQKHL